MTEQEKNKLNELGHAWYYAEEGEKKSLADEIALELFRIEYGHFDQNTARSQRYELEEQRGEFLCAFFDSRFNSFNPERSPFSAYYHSMKRLYEENSHNIDKEIQRHTVRRCDLPENHPDYCASGEQAQELVRKYIAVPTVSYSIDSDADEDEDDYSQANALLNSEELSTTDSYSQVEQMLGFLLEALNYKELKKKRLSYFRTFFTQDVSWYLRHCDERISTQHEEDTFEHMKVPFLDFTLIKICRTLLEISRSKLKLYGELVDGKQMIAIPEERGKNLSLPGDVYVSYFEKVENDSMTTSAVSQQMEQYRSIQKEYLRTQQS